MLAALVAFPAASFAFAPEALVYPPIPCADQDVTILVRGFEATPCDSFLSAERMDAHTIRVRTQVYSTRECLAAPFEFFSVPVVMGRFPAGSNQIVLLRETIVRDEVGVRDTTRTTSSLSFDVATSCSSASLPAQQLPFVEEIRAFPDPPCLGHGGSMAVKGIFPNGCGQVVSVDPATMTIVLAPDGSPGLPCQGGPAPWTAELPLEGSSLGARRATLNVTVVGNGPTPAGPTYTGFFDYEVVAPCPSDSLPYVDLLRVENRSACAASTIPCAGESLAVRIGGYLPACYWVASLEAAPPPPGSPNAVATVRLTIRDQLCTRPACSDLLMRWERILTLAPVAAGDHALSVVETRWLGCPAVADSHAVALSFHVTPAESCGSPPTPCLSASWLAATSDGCAAEAPPGGRAFVVLGIRSPIDLAGLEGTLRPDSGLAIVRLDPTGSAAGMHLDWTTAPSGAVHFVLFSSSGAPIPKAPPGATVEAPVLRVELAVDPNIAASRLELRLGPDLLGSDANGVGVALCPPLPCEFRLPPSAVICVEQADCDFNQDGILDVRDLVLMMRCVMSPATCPPDVAARFDCDRNGRFELDDVLCCANVLLRGPSCPQCPVDSVRAAPEIAVELGDPRPIEGGLAVTLRILGAAGLGGARLHLSFPDDRFTVAGVDGDPSWLHLHQEQGADLELALIQGGIVEARFAPPGPVQVTLRFALRPGRQAGGELSVVEGDFSGPDGVRLATSIGQPRVDLGGSVELSLSAARPNPFSGSTRFTVELARPGVLDVGIYDLAGRRVASVFHGALDAGSHPFVWSGATEGGTARGGVYFYRVSAHGLTLTRRLILLSTR